MKFLHFADFHLGMENYGHVVSQGFSQRVEEFLGVFDEMCEKVEKEGIDVVFFSGDAFKNREPSQTLVVAFGQRLSRMVKAGAQVFLLVGNHDLPIGKDRVSTLDIFSLLSMEGVYVGDPFSSVVVSVGNRKLEVVFAPWVHRQHVFDGESDMDQQSLSEALGDHVHSSLQSLDRDLDADVSVLLLHGTVGGAVFGAERSVAFGSDVVLDRDVLAGLGFDYVALGHIHKHQVVHTQPLMIYPGSPTYIDFSEEFDEKGYIVGEFSFVSCEGSYGKETSAVLCEWDFCVSERAARFVTLTLREDDLLDLEACLRSYADRIEDSVVRIICDVPAEVFASLDVGLCRSIISSLGARYYVGERLCSSSFDIGPSFERESMQGFNLEKQFTSYLSSRDISSQRQKQLTAKLREIMD